ncbi:hypothetical protein JHK84_049643 [Glycine max]|nr:hypothetical protein JHK86_049612 [Glycine max]KAG5094055.1 hypothetical protein JHK84_049643 [Glycine max]
MKEKVKTVTEGPHTGLETLGPNSSTLNLTSPQLPPPPQRLKKSVNAAFQRVQVDKIQFVDERLQDNSYWAKDGAENGYGAKVAEIVDQVRGRSKPLQRCNLCTSVQPCKKSKLPHATIFKARQSYKRCIADTFKNFPASSLPLIETFLTIDLAERQTVAAALHTEVMSVKALGIVIKLTMSGMNQLIYPQTWAFFLVMDKILERLQRDYLS